MLMASATEVGSITAVRSGDEPHPQWEVRFGVFPAAPRWVLQESAPRRVGRTPPLPPVLEVF